MIGGLRLMKPQCKNKIFTMLIGGLTRFRKELIDFRKTQGLGSLRNPSQKNK